MDYKKIPKVELHRHLECSLRFSTICELAKKAGIEVPKSEAEAKAKFLVMEPMRDLDSVLKKFLTTQKILSSEEILTRMTREVIEDASAEGIRILELRFAPTFIQSGHEHLSFDKIHAAIMKGVEQTKHLPIAVGMMVIIQRILPVKEAERVTDYVIAHKSDILALDLADNEVGFDCVPFAPVFERARKAGLRITIHAGEAPVPEAHVSVMNAIEQLGAERIGHGVQVIHHAPTMEYLKKNRIPLELCPTSNVLTNAVKSIAEHPFRKLMEFGVPVTLNSDDPGIFNIDLVNEYRELGEKLKFTQAEFDQINDTAAAASFIPMAEKQKHWPRPIRAKV